MADFKIATIGFLREKGWEIADTYNNGDCPTYQAITSEIPISGISSVDVNSVCTATSAAYASNQLVCEDDISVTLCYAPDIAIALEAVNSDKSVTLGLASVDTGLKALLIQQDGSFVKIPTNGNLGLTPAETHLYSATTVAAYIGPTVAYINGGTVGSTWMQTFYNFSKLESVILSDAVDEIGCFENCTSLRNIEFLNKVNKLTQSAFDGCTGLTGEIKIPDNVKLVGSTVFKGCTNITKISFGENSKLETFKSTDMMASPISGCTSLTTIVLPKSLKTLGRNSCADCSSLTTLIINATTPPTLGEDAFKNSDNCIIYVPSGSVNSYKITSGWSNYASRIQAIP